MVPVAAMSAGEGDPGPDVTHDTEWRVGRVDLRSPVSRHAWPIARVELEHDTRGRVTDIGSAPGAFDAAFAAAGQIIGVQPLLRRFDVRSASRDHDGALTIQIELELEIDGCVHVGRSVGVDLIDCSMRAWLEAVEEARHGGRRRDG